MFGHGSIFPKDVIRQACRKRSTTANCRISLEKCCSVVKRNISTPRRPIRHPFLRLSQHRLDVLLSDRFAIGQVTLIVLGSLSIQPIHHLLHVLTALERKGAAGDLGGGITRAITRIRAATRTRAIPSVFHLIQLDQDDASLQGKLLGGEVEGLDGPIELRSGLPTPAIFRRSQHPLGQVAVVEAENSLIGSPLFPGNLFSEGQPVGAVCDRPGLGIQEGLD